MRHDQTEQKHPFAPGIAGLFEKQLPVHLWMDADKLSYATDPFKFLPQVPAPVCAEDQKHVHV